jgi:pimeloyl-ACP methyl ester carboxylesterase
MFPRRLFLSCIACAAAFVLPSCALLPGDGPALTRKNLVEIGGGRRMNIVCAGHGTPTVVFDYGLGSHLLHWQKVSQPVAAMTRACFYDRAGYGYSDPSPRPMTADSVTNDLHALLGKAGISGPIVLVGHSAGGLYATLYNDKFDSHVAGLVLIDPGFAGLLEQHEKTLSPDGKRRERVQFEKDIADIRGCANLAREAKLSLADPHDCFKMAPGRTPAEIAYLADQFLKPFRYESVISELQSGHPPETGLSEDSQEETKDARPFGDKPVIVLTASIDPPGANYDEAEKKAWTVRWKAGHDGLAARSTRGESVFVPDSGHYIQVDQPAAVIDAIRKVVLQARESQAGRANR